MNDFARQDPPTNAPEKETLETFLDYHRATLRQKVAGLDDADLRRSFVPSGTNLLSLVKHLAYVERWWFQHIFAGEDPAFPWADENPDAEFRVEPHETAADVIAFYQQEARRSRDIAQRSALDDVAKRAGRRGEEFTLRWIMVHMIEETARHNGHADILRELTDGATGE